MRKVGQRVVSSPKIVILPSRAGVSPIRLRSVVVLPAPLRPEQRGDLALGDLEADAMQDVALAVIGVEAFGCQGCGHAALPR